MLNPHRRVSSMIPLLCFVVVVVVVFFPNAVVTHKHNTCHVTIILLINSYILLAEQMQWANFKCTIAVSFGPNIFGFTCLFSPRKYRLNFHLSVFRAALGTLCHSFDILYSIAHILHISNYEISQLNTNSKLFIKWHDHFGTLNAFNTEENAKFMFEKYEKDFSNYKGSQAEYVTSSHL